MTFVTHFVNGWTLCYVPMRLLGIDNPWLIYTIPGITGMVGTYPDSVGEEDKWTIEKKPSPSGKHTDIVIIRLGDQWAKYTEAHKGKIREKIFKYWVLPAMLHLWVDALIHPPTSIVDRDKNPKLYKFVWVVLEIVIFSISITLNWLVSR